MTHESPSAPTVSVIVPVYNGAATIGDCIRALLRLEYPTSGLELIVVDNGSTDETRAVLEEFRDRIRILDQPKRGAAAARNTGIRNATGACIALTDADCVVEADWLRHLLPPLADPAVGIVGGEILSVRPCNRIALFGEKYQDNRRAIEEFVPPYAITMNWASRRAVLEDAGLFDEALLRGQDVDLAYRVGAGGHRLVYCREARVFHRSESTFRGLFAKGFLHGQAAVMVLAKAGRLGLAPARRPLATERRILRTSGRWLAGPDRFDRLCEVVFDLGKAAGEIAAAPATPILAAVTAVLAGLYVASIGPYWNISPDSATYVGWGRSLAAGREWGSPPTTPPVTSLVFAAVLALFPGGYVALNAVTKLLIFGGLALAFILIRRRSGRTVAWLTVVLSLASTHVYHESTQLLSEPAYLLFSMAALLMLDEPARGDGTGDRGAAERSRPAWLREWAPGALLLVVVMTRYIGITLPLAVLLVEGTAVARRRRRPRLLLALMALLALSAAFVWGRQLRPDNAAGWFQTFVLVDPWTPSSGRLSAVALLERIRDNIGWLPAAGGMLFNLWSTARPKPDFPLQVAGLLVLATGLYLSLRRRLTVDGVYLALYLAVVAAHMLVGGYGDYRFLVPVAPLLFYYGLEAVRHLVRHTVAARLGTLPTTLVGGMGAFYVIAFVGLGLEDARSGVHEAHSSPFGEYPIKRPSNFDAERLALWLKSNSGPNDRYAAGQKDMFDVISERRGFDLLPARTSPHEAFVTWLEQQRVRYLLVDRTGSALGDSLLALVRAYPRVFPVIWELPRASLHQVTPRRN